MNDQILIRAVARGDFAEWKPLWDGYNAFYKREGPTAVPEEVTLATWERFFDPADPVHALVAELDGRLVGLTHYLFHPATNQRAPLCYLSDLFTAEDVRGRGAGKALIEAVCARAKEAGANRVYWQTHESNATARRLYDKVAELSSFIVYRKVL